MVGTAEPTLAQNGEVPRGLSSRRRTFLVGLALAGVLGAGAAVLAATRADDRPRGLVEAPLPQATGSTTPGSAPTGGVGQVPVVLVHGFGGTTDNMTTIAARLRADGRETISVSLPELGTADIGLSVREVERVVRASGARTVDLVGYSLGGVVVRAWVDSGSDSASPRRVVTIASPHHGAQLAETAAVFDPSGCVGACAQLRPGSQFLRELNAPDETPGPAAWTTIWTSRDETVTPPESARLTGAVNVRLQDVCPDSGVGHGSINRNPLPMGLVVLALRGELGATPSAARCAEVRELGSASS